jgi:hypothetical protein
MADGKKVKLDTPFKDAVCKPGGGLGSPAPVSSGTQKGK